VKQGGPFSNYSYLKINPSRTLYYRWWVESQIPVRWVAAVQLDRVIGLRGAQVGREAATLHQYNTHYQQLVSVFYTHNGHCPNVGTLSESIKKVEPCKVLYLMKKSRVPSLYTFFKIVFYSSRDASPSEILIFNDTVIFPGPVQETVRGAGFEPGTAASSVWCRPVALAN
jgi:hypothetical protein